MNPDESVAIRQAFDTGDPTVYQWSTDASQRSLSYIFGYLFGGIVIFPFMAFGFFWLISFLSESFAFWFAVVMAFLMTMAMINALINSWTGKGKKKFQAKAEVYIPAIMVIGIIFYLIDAPNSDLPKGFSLGEATAEAVTWTGWIVYFLDNLLSVVLLDIPEVFGIHVSDVRPETFLAKTLTVTIRLLMTLGIIELFFAIYRNYFSRQEFYCTTSECLDRCKDMPGVEGTFLVREGHVEADRVAQVSIDRFLRAYGIKK